MPGIASFYPILESYRWLCRQSWRNVDLPLRAGPCGTFAPLAKPTRAPTGHALPPLRCTTIFSATRRVRRRQSYKLNWCKVRSYLTLLIFSSEEASLQAYDVCHCSRFPADTHDAHLRLDRTRDLSCRREPVWSFRRNHLWGRSHDSIHQLGEPKPPLHPTRLVSPHRCPGK